MFSSILVSSAAASSFAFLFCCFQISELILFQMANFVTLWQISVKLAPEYPCIFFARNTKLTLVETGNLLKAALRSMDARVCQEEKHRSADLDIQDEGPN